MLELGNNAQLNCNPAVTWATGAGRGKMGEGVLNVAFSEWLKPHSFSVFEPHAITDPFDNTASMW